MNTEQETGAWLEAEDGAHYQIHGSCSLGRVAANHVVLDSPKVSRRHALIHVQNMGEFWLIDFGSSNGTFLNKRRIHQPARLSDRDQITIGDQRFTFREPQALSDEFKTMVAQQTLRAVADLPCWLMVADIRDFTLLSRSMKNEGLEALLGGWLSACREIIETRHGIVNKYLGDSFLAYWPERDTSPEEIAGVLHALKELRARRTPDFRVVVHRGSVVIGGVASMGEESLIGKEVNFIFRLEKLAATLGEACGLSDAAQAKLQELVPARCLGEHELKGFEGARQFFGAL